MHASEISLYIDLLLATLPYLYPRLSQHNPKMDDHGVPIRDEHKVAFEPYSLLCAVEGISSLNSAGEFVIADDYLWQIYRPLVELEDRDISTRSSHKRRTIAVPE